MSHVFRRGTTSRSILVEVRDEARHGSPATGLSHRTPGATSAYLRPFGEDGDFTEERFIDLYRRELAGQLGSLYDTTVEFCRRSAGAPPREVAAPAAVLDWESLPSLVGELHGTLGQCDYHAALASIMERVVAPAAAQAHSMRALYPGGGSDPGEGVTAGLIEALRVMAVLLKPFTPATAARIYATFGFRAAFETLSLEDVCRRDSPSSVTLGRMMQGNGDAAPLFAAPGA